MGSEMSEAWDFHPANEFKETEIGPMPHDWHVVDLGEVAALSLGRTPARKEQNYWTNGTVPWVAIKDLNNGIITNTAERISRCAFDEVMRNKIVPAGTLLLSFKLTIGKVGILGIDAVHNEAIASVTPDETKAHRDYLFFLLQWVDYDAYLDTYVKGKTLNKRKLSALSIPLPSLPEQHRIADVLSMIQRAIEAQDKVIAAAKELKRSLMQRVFTYGPGPEPAPTKETEIGKIPGAWKVLRLKELARVVRGGSPRPKGDPKYFADKPTGIHWIMISDLTKHKKGRFITSTEEYLTEEGKKESRYLTIGTLVVTNSGTVGIPAFLGISGCIHDGYLALLDIDRSRIDEEYLYYWFVLIRRYLERIAPRGTQANLNTTIAKNLQIPIPSLAVQREIARVLCAVDRRVEAEEDRSGALQVLFKSMLHQLMTGRLRVKDIEV